MLKGSLLRRLRLGITCAATLLIANTAYAVPPPPPFTTFQIVNQTGQNIAVLLRFTPSTPVTHADLDPDKKIEVLVSPVRAMTRFDVAVAGLPGGNYDSGFWGISQIEVTASYCNGDQAYSLNCLSLTAPNHAWTYPANSSGYAGYVGRIGTQITTPVLTLGADQDGIYGSLHATWLWSANEHSNDNDLGTAAKIYFAPDDSLSCP